MLLQLPKTARDPRLLVGANTADDAGVYRLGRNQALVQTVDFFTPIVDDPFAYGQIAAANALSDVYAMGGRPLTAMNLLGMPEDLVPPEIVGRILSGGAAKVAEAGCALVGGHSIRNPEPIYGLSVTGLVSPKRMLTNANARPGDLLVLTKPLGMGVATTAIKRGLASAALEKRAILLMSRLNDAGADIAEASLARAATDITGFGLLGHLGSTVRASGVGAEIDSRKVPALSREIAGLIAQDCVPGGSRQNLEHAMDITEFDPAVPEPLRVLLADAQTSGGLLICVAPRRLDAVIATLKRNGTPVAARIGRIVRSKKPSIRVLA